MVDIFYSFLSLDLLQATMQGVSTTGCPYFNECSYIFRVNPDETGALKIHEVYHFMDSMVVSKFFPEEHMRRVN
jgi:hypothetical protein